MAEKYSTKLRPKYGPLSTFDLLPEEAEEDVSWAFEEALHNKRLKVEVLAELNERLAARGIAPVKKSAFYERVRWLKAHGAALLKSREITTAMANRVEAAAQGEGALALDEVIKSIVCDILINKQLTEGVTMAMAANAASVLQRLEIARKVSLETQREAEAFAAKAKAAAGRAGAAKGLTAEQVAEIKSKILGIDLTKDYGPIERPWRPEEEKK